MHTLKSKEFRWSMQDQDRVLRVHESGMEVGLA